MDRGTFRRGLGLCRRSYRRNGTLVIAMLLQRAQDGPGEGTCFALVRRASQVVCATYARRNLLLEEQIPLSFPRSNSTDRSERDDAADLGC